MTEVLTSNPFWLFIGIVAGAMIQHFLGWLERHRQASTALRVLQIEVERNLKEAEKYIAEIHRQLQLVAAKEIEVGDVYFPTEGFDYSAMSPLNNSGYLHLLLGDQALSDLLRFNGHFNNHRREILRNLLMQHAANGSATSFLQSETERATEYSKGLRRLTSAKKKPLRFSLSY